MAAKPGKCCGFGVLAFFVLGCDIHWGVSQTWPRLGAIVRKSVSGLSIVFFFYRAIRSREFAQGKEGRLNKMALCICI